MPGQPDCSRVHDVSRRDFLRTAAASATTLACSSDLATGAPWSERAPSGLTSGGTTTLSAHLLVHQGPVNVGIVRDGNRALLIDCGDGSVAAALPELGIDRVERIVCTHYHRDQVCGAPALAAGGAKIGVPAAERECFANPAAYWNDDQYLWRVIQSFRPDHLMPTEPLPVDEAYADGHELRFGPATIRVLDTPGHTDGGVSYLVEVDGRRVIFCGDCICGPGQVWDIYSLQNGFRKGGQQVGGYHGFMGDRPRLVESLGRIKQTGAQTLVPAHGSVLTQPAEAIDQLVHRFEECYEKYVGISALRHYFPPLFTEYAGRPGQMPIRAGIAPPDCLRHFGTTWMLVSQDGAALVMDVGGPGIVKQIKRMLGQGEIKSVDGLWVTHYHYDHTDGIGQFQQEFDCPCITDRRLAEVLTNPRAWRLPCLAPAPIRVDRPMEDGQSWQWREFKMTSYFYPGQTLYHAALLVEAAGLRLFFVGDSHTMAGIDDYCAYNRNWLGRSVGFQYGISLIERLSPTHIFNCHVHDAFTFTPEEIRFMRENLDARERLFGELVPWEHANYGMDASWVRCYPYTQKARPGDGVRLQVVVTNHSSQATDARCRAVLPRAFGGNASAWVPAVIPAKVEGEMDLAFDVPASAAPGRYVVPIDIEYGRWHLPQFAEAIVDV